MMQLVDFHCHLDLYPDWLAKIQESETLRIHTLTMTNTPSVWERNMEMCRTCKYVHVALGLHPQLAVERERELALFEKYLPSARFVGEVGLDGSQGAHPTYEVQKTVFHRILQLCASAGEKILSVHSRGAARDVIDSIATHFPMDGGRVILHWFTGSREEAKSALETGCYFSVNVRMVESRYGRELIKFLPHDRVLTETDGPFIRSSSGPHAPKDVARLLSSLAVLWRVDPDVVQQTVLLNMSRMLDGTSEP